MPDNSTMTLSLANRRVVVLGGSSGIGFAVATLAREFEAQVVIASSTQAKVDAAVSQLPGSTGQAVDLRDEGRVAEFFADIGPFDHLVITAGDWNTALFGGIGDLDLAACRAGLDVRFWGLLAALQHASRTIAADGSITLTSGMLVHRPQKGMVMAAAVGGAVEHLARAAAVDLAPVRVNAVCPGLVLTGPVRQMPPETIQGYIQPLPLPRVATPEEAATAYLYCMLNGYVTGQILPVDGGGHLV